MRNKLIKVDNEVAVKISKSHLNAAGLKVGDAVEFESDDSGNALIFRKAGTKRM